MNEKYIPFGGKKHVVIADARHCGAPPHFHVSVVFRAPEELEALIESLTELHKGWDDPTGHIHLQDHKLTSDGDPTRVEILFMTSTWANTECESELRNSLIDEARSVLENI